MSALHKPVHPGEVLLEAFLLPTGIKQSRLARTISASPQHVNLIVHGTCVIPPDTALRLSTTLGTSIASG
jgi:addiction module HigA family antidote